jgi:hypothetical protein
MEKADFPNFDRENEESCRIVDLSEVEPSVKNTRCRPCVLKFKKLGAFFGAIIRRSVSIAANKAGVVT